MSQPVALFDFDGTLTVGDTLMPFLKAVVGPWGLAGALARSAPWLVGYGARVVRNDVAKQRLLAAALGGRRHADLQSRGREFARDRVPALLRRDMMALLRHHRGEGRFCILVSASLDVYLEPWAQAEGFDAVLCSRLETDTAGNVTGRLLGGNCHGQEKVARLRSLFAQWDGPPTHIVAYGDTNGDRPMLALADCAFLMRDGRPVEIG